MLRISSRIELPYDYATQTVAILAKRRVGKTYTASVIAEECCEAKIPFVVLDPTGAWWGMRSSADGKHDGYPVVIIGGAHGDIPLESGAGKAVAEFIVEHPGFYIVDLSGTTSNSEQDKFATDFAERLYRLKDKHRDPLHLFVDEADAFVPQRPFPNQTRMLGAFEALVRRGGIRGIGITLISQRAAVVNKNVLTQTETLIVLQTTGPQDVKAIDDWVKLNADPGQRELFLKSLASLAMGEAWLWSPAWLGVFEKINIRNRKTFNSSATPKVGDKSQEPAKLATVDLESLRSRMAETIEKAQAEDPKYLKAELIRLQKELDADRRKPVQTEKVEVEIPIFPIGAKLELDDICVALSRQSSAIEAIQNEIDLQHNKIRDLQEKYSSAGKEFTNILIAASEPYIIKFYGNGDGANSIDDPLSTVTARDRFALCIPTLSIALDIRFRMLQPHELAAAMSFPKDYEFTGNREAKVKQIGNAVPLKTAKALCKVLLG